MVAAIVAGIVLLTVKEGVLVVEAFIGQTTRVVDYSYSEKLLSAVEYEILDNNPASINILIK